MGAISGEFICPHCQQMLRVENAEPEQIVLCSACGGEFALPAIEISDEPSAAAPPEELDALRIRQLALMKRSAYRGKSYAIIAACVCTVAVAQLGVMAVRELLNAGWDVWSVGYIAGIVVCVLGAWHFTGKALQLQQEIARTLVSTSATPTPDFSSLGDGSQRVRNLEEMK
jgi:hypothetical protein